jgi:TetR/AcrR family transcriptional regulator
MVKEQPMFHSSDSEEGLKEQIILEAAMDEFIAHGWTGARMQAIADRAGINKTLLHYYFRSKKNLYQRILYRVMKYFFGRVLGNIVESGSFEEFLRVAIDTIVDESGRNPRLPMFLMQELSMGGKTARVMLRNVLKEQEEPITAVMLEKVRKGIEEGVIRSVDPGQFILTLIGSCLYFALAEPIIMEIGSLEGFVEGFDRDGFLQKRKKEIFSVLYYGVRKRESEE